MSEKLDPKLVQRIQKLHAMAESARDVGSLAEADSFMSAVHKTLAAYNLDTSVLTIDMKDAADPLGQDAVLGAQLRHKDKPLGWAQDLAGHVARAHNCAHLISTTSSYVFFYGRASNRGVAVKMFKYLRDMAERLGQEAYVTEAYRRRRTGEGERGSASWRFNWMEGFVEEIGRRYQTMRQRVESDKGMGLVLVSVRKEARDYSHEVNQKAWDEAKAKKLKWKSKETLAAQFYNEAARNNGAETARNVNLSPNAVDVPESTTQRRLS